MDTTRSAHGTEKTGTFTWVRRLAISGALAASLAAAASGAGAQESEPGNFFDRTPRFAVSRNSVDPFDPFAPVGFDGSGTAFAYKTSVPAAKASVAWAGADLPPTPGLPGESF